MDSERSAPTFMGLTLPQVGGGALAAVTAALAASRLGVTGTIAGAAFGSVVSTVAGAMYTQSLHRAQTQVTVTRQRLVRSTAQDRSDPSALPTDLDDEAQVVAESVSVTAPEGTEPGGLPDNLPGSLTGADPTSSTSPAPGERDRSRRPIKWLLVIGAAAVIFAIAMVLISVLETAIGRPVSGGTSGTTISQIGSGGAAEPDPTPSTTGEPSVQPSTDSSGGSTPTDAASPQDSPSEVAPAPSVDAASPTPGPADTSPAAEPAPTDAAPAPAPAAS